MIVGSFLLWSTGVGEQSGWEAGDGIFTVIAGVIGSAAAGPIFVGFRHNLPRAIALVSGLAGLVVVAISFILSLESGAETGIGTGMIIAGLSAAAMVLAGIADDGAVNW